MRSEPNAKSEVVAKIPLNQEVFLLDDKVAGDGWLHVKTRSGRTGYVHRDFIKKYKMQKKATRAEVLENADQRCAVIFAKMDEWKDGYDGSLSGRFLLLVGLLSFVFAAVVYFFPSARWAHYLLMLLTSASIVYLYALIPDGSYRFDFWLLTLICALLFIASPFLLFFNLLIMLYNSWCDRAHPDGTFITLHVFVAVLMFAAFYLCTRYSPKNADAALYAFLIVQGVIFLVFLIKAISSHHVINYMLYLFVFVVLFLPAATLAMNVLLIALPAIIVLGILVTPTSGHSSSGGGTTELLDEAGRHVADIDGSGRDANTGRRYDRDSNNNWHEV